MGPDVAEGRVGMRGGRASDCVGLRALRSSFVQELALVLARVHFPKHVLSLYFYCLNQQYATQISKYSAIPYGINFLNLSTCILVVNHKLECGLEAIVLNFKTMF